MRGRQWKPLFLRSAGIYAPDGGKNGDKEIPNVIFTTTVLCKHRSSTRGEMSMDATMKSDGITDERPKFSNQTLKFAKPTVGYIVKMNNLQH